MQSFVTMSSEYLLRAENISKSFPGVKALDDVQLYVEKGKVHAVMGENGAGKSTLMKILIGMYTPDSGHIIFKGKPVIFHSVHDALKAGFAMIHQELMPFPELSVAENIYMGNEPLRPFTGWINLKKRNKNAQLLMDKLGLAVSVTRKMKTLSVAEMQMVEIAKAIANKAEVIIMDEPTSALSDRETVVLFNLIHELKNQGMAIIYISHKMDEILQIADTISVMRDGRYIATCPAGAVNNEQLISLIVGRELNTIFEKSERMCGETVLSVKGLTGNQFTDINFFVRSGEILGIAGLMGSGRSEIANAIFGLEARSSGTIMIKGKPVMIRSPRDAIRLGIGLIPEERKTSGLVLSATVKHNITLAALKSCSRGVFIDLKKESDIADHQILSFSVKTPSANQLVNYLSGGNQQKVVLAKVLLNDPDIIILDEPTRGIDIGAKTEIYKLLNALASKGKAIIMISSELPEILGMSDRIIVLHEGRLTAELSASEATQEKVMQYAMM